MNYFEIFGLPEVFNLDLAQLTERYQTIQKSVHPDRFAHASSQEQAIAVKKSTLVNDAFQTLKNPLKRAHYMLEQRGVDLPSEQASFSDNSFLMRQMELREMLDEVRYAEDADAAIFAASQTLDSEYQTLYVALQALLDQNTEQSNQQASEHLRKLTFYHKLQIELDKIEDLRFDD